MILAHVEGSLGIALVEFKAGDPPVLVVRILIANRARAVLAGADKSTERVRAWRARQPPRPRESKPAPRTPRPPAMTLKERQARYREKNRDEIKARKKAWRAARKLAAA